jgi:O-antigen/teichoic acid export membrane protein
MSALGALDSPTAPGSAERVAGLRPPTSLKRGVALLSLLSITASVINYGSNLAFARVLTPASYGDLTSLLALSMVLAVPLTAAQTRVASRIASHAAEHQWSRVRYTVRHALAHLLVLAIGGTALYGAFIPVVIAVFHLQAPGPAIALAALIFVGFLFPVLLGALQGLERWVAFGLVGVAVALARVVFGIPWAVAGGGAGGAIAGQALGMTVCLGLVVWALRRHVAGRGQAAARLGIRRRPDLAGVAAGGAFVCFAAIANCDVVLAKIFLSPAAAGQYAALATIGKIIVFLPAAVSVVVVPGASRAGSSRPERERVLRTAALFVLGASLLAMIPAAVEPRLLVQTMFGVGYLSASSGVLPIVCAGGGLALLYLLATYTAAIQDARWGWLLALGIGLQVLLVGLFHRSATQVAEAQAATVVTLLLVNEVRFHSLFLRRGRA